MATKNQPTREICWSISFNILGLCSWTLPAWSEVTGLVLWMWDGGFHGHGGYPQNMDALWGEKNINNSSIDDDPGVPPFQETSTWFWTFTSTHQPVERTSTYGSMIEFDLLTTMASSDSPFCLLTSSHIYCKWVFVPWNSATCSETPFTKQPSNKSTSRWKLGNSIFSWFIIKNDEPLLRFQENVIPPVRWLCHPGTGSHGFVILSSLRTWPCLGVNLQCSDIFRDHIACL